MLRYLLVGFAFLTAAPSWAADPVLTVAARDKAPVVDGVVGTGEYGGSLVLGRYSISMSRVGEELYIGISAQTSGWVAVGLGSMRMAGATIFIGYVARDGLKLEVQRGTAAHTHVDAPADPLLASAGTETGGRTTIEIKVKAAPFLAAGAREIPMIVAYGNVDSFSVPHVFRSPLLTRL